MQATPIEIVTNFYAAYSRRDTEALLSYVSDDVVEILSGIPPIIGIKAEREFFEGLFAGLPDMQTKLLRAHQASPNLVVAEWERSGTFSGNRFQGIRANGKPYTFKGLALLQIENGLITVVNGYYDTTDFARQIGMLPPQGSMRERASFALFNLLTILTTKKSPLKLKGQNK